MHSHSKNVQTSIETTIKFMFSKKGIVKAKVGDFIKLFGLLRKHEFYQKYQFHFIIFFNQLLDVFLYVKVHFLHSPDKLCYLDTLLGLLYLSLNFTFQNAIFV